MIDIILATFNGEKYLAEQIASIQANKGYEQWVNKIIITDDGSSDNTKNIVLTLAGQDPKISWYENNSKKKGPKGNFEFGLKQSTAEYLMFCDQDDIWLPHKIEISIERLLHAQKPVKPNQPILVFSDKQIVDEKLNLICESYFSLKNINKKWHHRFDQLCQQNVVSGCTMLFNRALINKALPIPEQAYMHDWWIALVAVRCGEVHFIDQALIQYRQHSTNAIGARKRNLASLFIKFNMHFKAFKKSQQSIIHQAIAFKNFEQKNKLSANETIAILSGLNDLTITKKMSYFCKGKVTRSHFLGRVALLVSLLASKNKSIKKQTIKNE